MRSSEIRQTLDVEPVQEVIIQKERRKGKSDKYGKPRKREKLERKYKNVDSIVN